jgi:hypothetical protein
MSPVPPNKLNSELNEKEPSDGEINETNETTTQNHQEPTEQNDDNDEFDQNYEPLAQNQNEYQIDNGEDDSEDDWQSDEDNEPNPDEDFHVLAYSRANQVPSRSKKDFNFENFKHMIDDHDVFEQKSQAECENFELDEVKSKTVTSLMANFNLPESAIPDWAKKVPESVWKKQLTDYLDAKRANLFESTKNDSTS